MQTDAKLKRHARRLATKLAELYPNVRSPLSHDSPVQLLVATILSAQCTDARVNKITPALFGRYPDAAAFATADQEELETYIKPTGFFRNKARNIIACCRQLVEKHDGQVPMSLEELVPLAGIGRKTANVVLGNAFGVPGITVDTHVGRLSRRLGLSTFKNPVKVERDLMKLIPKREWSRFSLRLIFHGRRVCRSRKPRCGECILARWCPKIGVNRDGQAA
jgi:endonuclease-3